MAGKKAGEFKADVIRNVMFRAGLICSNPYCMVLTVGPVEFLKAPAIKIGEAAHIIARSPDGPRGRLLGLTLVEHYKEVQKENNAIWLCASCHEEIDKDNGKQHGVGLVRKWKKDHEKRIADLYCSRTSPVPLLRHMTDNGKVAQAAVETVEEHEMLCIQMAYEDPVHVLVSMNDFRKKFEDLAKQVHRDQTLKTIIRTIAGAAKRYMNFTSKSNRHWTAELETFRRRCAVQFKILVDDWNCEPGQGCTQLIGDYAL